MGHVRRILASAAILMAGALPLAAFDGPTQTTSGSKKTTAGGTEQKTDAAADKAQDKAASTAQRMLEAGVEAYEAGKFAQAVRAFDEAMRSGGLKNPEMAKALYYRGMTFRKLGKPGLAISDLTSAIWLKEGLSPSEKQEALKNRVAAYHQAGISDAPDLSQSVPTADAAPAATPAGAAATAGGWQTAMTDATSAPTSAPAQSSGGGISDFFSSIAGIFGGGASSSSAPSANNQEVTTASIAPEPSSPAGEAMSWSQTTQVSTANPAPPTATASPPPPAPKRTAAVDKATQAAKRKAAPAHSGKYRLQVASVRTRAEADLTVARLLTQYGGELDGRDPVVDEAVIGNMGTFYRVRVGPYANAKEPRQLCNTLQASGYDCVVVTK